MKLIVKKSKKNLFKTIKKIRTRLDGEDEDIVISVIELKPTKKVKIK